MGGPIFGASGKINLAYYDALKSMSQLSTVTNSKNTYSSQASALKANIIAHLWNSEAGIMRMSDITSPTGVCQDINAYAITTGVAPEHSQAEATLSISKSSELPCAFTGIERWDQKKVVSPYASGFAAEALFERDCGSSAIELVERVWGVMADESGPDYSGGHWEAMKPDGTPITDDTSLMHGWSTWPVYLLPRYLGGLKPLEAGWKRFMVKPVLVGVEEVDVQMSTPAGRIEVSLRVRNAGNQGRLSVLVPFGATADIHAPEGWSISAVSKISEHAAMAALTVAGDDKVILFDVFHEKAGSTSSSSLVEKHMVETTSDEVVEASTCGFAWFMRFPVFRRVRSWFS